MKELWKDVVNFEDKYEVSNLGNLRSKTRNVNTKGGKTRTVKGKVLKKQVNKSGYHIIGLSLATAVKTFTVHQLVAHAFIPNFKQSTEINHIDGNKQNNAVTNLEESNPSHNQIHAVSTGLRPKTGKSKYNNVSYINKPNLKKRWAACVQHAGKTSYGWKTFYTEIEAAKHVDSILDEIGDTVRNRNFP